MEDDDLDFNALMQTIMAYAFIGQAAFIGMIISGLLLLVSLVGPIGFSPMFGFITVPLACLYLGFKARK